MYDALQMKRISKDSQLNIVNLRLLGRSIPEISQELHIAKTTIQRYVVGIDIPPAYRQRLREKQGGSRERAAGVRANVYTEAQTFLSSLSQREYILLLTALYWGEGTKRDFSIINSDPNLIQTFIAGLHALGIERSRISIAIRLHSGLSIERARLFWSLITNIPIEQITQVEIIEGKKKGKLPHGMCRIRVRKGIRERLFLQSLISLIGKESNIELVSG